MVSGTFNQLTVSGSFTQTANENENLVSGTASDSGTVGFSGMSDSSGYAVSALDAQGQYQGTSSIPLTAWCGSIICQTGFLSQGSFNIQAQAGNGHIKGTYNTAWSTPALTFTSSIVAVAQSH